MSRLFRAEPPRRALASGCRLQAFHPGYAGLVVSWVLDPREAYWLAPRSRPPLTVSSVLEWLGPGRQSFLLLEAGQSQPAGYGEINALDVRARRYWLGHLIIDPERRGCGLGVVLTRLLLQHAFRDLRAREVSLVVFPENTAAIASYRAAGMTEDGEEIHEFPSYGVRARMLRMAIRALPS